MKTEDRRITKRQKPDGSFEVISFHDLKKGDKFHHFLESTGEPIEVDPTLANLVGPPEGKLFTALSDARPAAPRSLCSPLAAGEEDPWEIKVDLDKPA